MMPKHIAFRSRTARGFTLVELLVVLGIMLLILAVAVPSIKVLSGTRSYEVAVNKISAYLNQARLIAVSQAQETGVMFYLDPQTQMVTMTLVYTVPPSQVAPAGQNPLDPNHYLNLVSNAGGETLPSGLGFQTINAIYNPGPNSTTANLSQYDYFLPGANGTTTPFIGDVIMFDTYGQFATIPCGYCFQMVNVGSTTPTTTDMYNLLFFTPGKTTPPTPSAPTWLATPAGASSPSPVLSTVGFVLYDPNAYSASGNTLGASGNAQDAWVNQNSQLFMVNRNTGTLLKSE